MANQQLWKNICAIACPGLIVASLFVFFFICIKLALSEKQEYAKKSENNKYAQEALLGLAFVVIACLCFCFR